MGVLAKALEAQSSHAAKKTGLWGEIEGVIDLAMTTDQLAEAQASIEARELQIPRAWWGPIRDRLALKAEEIASEDVGQILRDRFDF